MNKTFDRFAGLAFAAVGVAFMVLSKQLSTSAYGSEVGPDIFPFWLGLLLCLLSVRLLYETLKYKDGTKAGAPLDYKRFLIIFVSAVLYAWFIEDIGYVIGTFLFLVIGFQTMERGKWLTTIMIAGGFSFGVYYVFVKLLQGSLPGLPAWLGGF